MLHRVIGREREKKRDLALNTRDFKETSNIPPLWSCPHLHHVTDLTYVCWPLWFYLNASLTANIQETPSDIHIYREIDKQTDITQGYRLCLWLIVYKKSLGWLAGLFVYAMWVWSFISPNIHMTPCLRVNQWMIVLWACNWNRTYPFSLCMLLNPTSHPHLNSWAPSIIIFVTTGSVLCCFVHSDVPYVKT